MIAVMFTMEKVEFLEFDLSKKTILGKEYTQSFSVKKYGDEGAKQMALNARDLMNKRFNSHNGKLNNSNIL